MYVCNRRNRRNRRNRQRPPRTLETTFLDQFLTLILMVTSDFAHSVGAIPYFMMVVIGSATPEREAAYRRYVRYITWKPGLDQCCTRFTRCLCITPRASSHAAWSVARSGSGMEAHVLEYMAVLKGLTGNGQMGRWVMRLIGWHLA